MSKDIEEAEQLARLIAPRAWRKFDKGIRTENPQLCNDFLEERKESMEAANRIAEWRASQDKQGDSRNPYDKHCDMMKFMLQAGTAWCPAPCTMQFYIPIMFKDVFHDRVTKHAEKHYPDKFEITTEHGVAGQMIKIHCPKAPLKKRHE